MRPSFSGHVASAHPSVLSYPRRLNRSAENDGGEDIGTGGLSGFQFTGETYSCNSLPAFSRSICAIPCTRTRKFTLKSRSIHRLIFPVSRSSDSPAISTVAVLSARFHRIVNGIRTSSCDCRSAIAERSAGVSGEPFARMA